MNLELDKGWTSAFLSSRGQG